MTEEAVIETGDTEYTVEVADTLLSRAWGLSLRSEGKMLFKFSKPVRTGIDMMLLSRPLHLYFLDEEKTVIEVQKAEPWGFNPKTWQLYRSEKPYTYLIESFEPLDISEGETLRITEE